jgi:hypothetical protein
MNSKDRVRAALPTWNGRLAAHHMCYNGNLQVHRAIPYAAFAYTAPVVEQKLEMMADDGVDICITTWQGPWNNGDALLFSAMCAEMGMQFALLLDPGGMQKWVSPVPSAAVITANVVEALQAVTTQSMLNASSYVPEKWILDFGTGANLISLAASFPTLSFLAKGAGFSWINIPPASITDSPLKNAWAVANLEAQHALPTMKIASFCDGFDDSGQPLPIGVSSQAAFDAAGGNRNWAVGVWGNSPARVLESFAGQFGEQQLATISPATPVIAILTWDDYDEQSSGPREKVLAELHGVDWSTI